MPPYWSSPEFLTVLQMSSLAYFGEWGNWGEGREEREENWAKNYSNRTFARMLHNNGMHHAVQYLRTKQRQRDGHWKDIEAIEKRLRVSPHAGLWAGALIPPSWHPTVDVPEDWIIEKKKISEEIALYETPRAWVVEWNVSDGHHNTQNLRLMPSNVEDPSRKAITYPFEAIGIRFQHIDQWGEKMSRDSARVLVNGDTLYVHEGDIVRWTYRNKPKSSLGFGSSPYCASIDDSIHNVLYEITSRFWAVRAFSSKEAAEEFEQEVKARQGQPIEDEE